MKKALILFLFFLTPLFSLSFEEAKEEITTCQNLLLENPNESSLYFRLALAHLADQELNAAFKNFLRALDTVESKEPLSLEAHKEVVDFYLKQGEGNPIATAKKMLSQYESGTSKELNFILSMAYANLGDYETFFHYFYEGYPHLKETFLAAKTRGILYLRLSQHETSDVGRCDFREKAFHFMTKGLECYPLDPSLYKVLIFLAKDEKNDALIGTYLHKIVENRVTIPRADIYLYVREAVAICEVELGQKLIDEARKNYTYSRAVEAAQEYLNQHLGGI
ncbi:MAG: hypothetical protein S4CHLAM45_14980 [Chlamydiales bacterium]|nr:hypothetical protein [Chlamydiales bacterium]MCH9620115.1 hypothetical protein [Chlamydiales bacterium]MCH9623585.1 hypothetical protein [Chlamydiales bacterium]